MTNNKQLNLKKVGMGLVVLLGILYGLLVALNGLGVTNVDLNILLQVIKWLTTVSTTGSLN